MSEHNQHPLLKSIWQANTLLDEKMLNAGNVPASGSRWRCRLMHVIKLNAGAAYEKQNLPAIIEVAHGRTKSPGSMSFTQHLHAI
jgi:hypothetical protein